MNSPPHYFHVASCEFARMEMPVLLPFCYHTIPYNPALAIAVFR